NPAGQTDISVPGGSTSSFIDQLGSGQGACYQLLARDVKGEISGRSDMLCAMPGTGTAAGPRNISATIAVDAAGSARNAVLNWTAPASGTVSNYMVLPVGTTRFQILSGGTTTATDATGGAAICYLVGAATSAGAVNVGDIVCVVPNLAGFQ